MPPMFVADLVAGDVFHHRMPGGGGWGDPFEREPDAVARDVLDEKVSIAAARELYGVVVGRDGSVELAATDDLRRTRVGGAR
jgi:N-methylhydantoinase B